MKKTNKESNDLSSSSDTPPASTNPSDEYFKLLERWLQEAYMWQCMNAWFPYVILSQQTALQAQNGTAGTTEAAGSSLFAAYAQSNSATQPAANTNVRALDPRQAHPLLGVEYRIPPLWKRFAAEFLDFLILFSLKLVITLVAVDIFDFIDLDNYDLDLLNSESKLDYKMALQMTTEILFLEVIHRIVVCIFEVVCLYQGSEGRIGGATPGKNTLGLKVITCERVVPGRQPRSVIVYPATDLGLPVALWRSLVKNTILAFFFPICFTLIFFQHNRTAYDVLCRTIVVEDVNGPPILLRPRQQQQPQP